MDAQADLFPHATPETVLAYCRRLEARVLAIAPELTREECWMVLGQIAIAELVLDTIDVTIRAGRAWQVRQALPPFGSGLPQMPSSEARPRWTRPAVPVRYRP